jgi:HEAT repeat protein
MQTITGIALAALVALAAGHGDGAGRAPFHDDAGALVPSAQTANRWFAEDPADSLYRVARETLNKGDYRRAATLFGQVVARYPDSQYVPDAMYYQAFALYSAGSERNLRDALEILDAQRRRFPDAATSGDAGALATRVRGLLARGGDAQSAQHLQALARADSQRAAARPGGGGTAAPCNEDDDSDIRIAALNALLQMDSEQALPILKQVLARRDSCSEVLRRKAVFLVAQKRGSETADILLNVARNDPDAETRRNAVFWLSEVRSDRAIAALDSILTGSRDEELQEKAIFALSNSGTTRGMEILRRYAGSSGPEELRAKAVFWLGQSSRRQPENAAFLRSLFERSDSEEIRSAVVQAVADGGEEANIRWLLGIAADTKYPLEVRKKALFWSGQQHRTDVALIIPMYDRLGDSEMKEHFIFVLSQRHEPAATDKLIAIVRTDRDSEMRKKALFWLGQKNDPRVKQLLLEILDK